MDYGMDGGGVRQEQQVGGPLDATRVRPCPHKGVTAGDLVLLSCPVSTPSRTISCTLLKMPRTRGELSHDSVQFVTMP